ncbi:MAG: DUF134 domain-containing protein [Oscillospiraceae bacterium]|nr:DUF134 domain-containing protein [Oscillospiraceae bacterium]
MPRPTKCRMICRLPQTIGFDPLWGDEARQPVVLTVDEYETIRLIDKEGLSQEQCSQRMQIARTTAQRVYETARKKLADALVDCRPLRIEGGEYRVCDGQNRFCGSSKCFRRELYQIFNQPKGERVTRIAVAYEDGQVFQHFGRMEKFKVYDVEDGKVTSAQVVDTEGRGHGALAEVLTALHTDILICGGIGGGAQAALAAAGIQLYGGASGSADGAVEALLAGKLTYDLDFQCAHHDEHHHDGQCSDHGCGRHSC